MIIITDIRHSSIERKMCPCVGAIITSQCMWPAEGFRSRGVNLAVHYCNVCSFSSETPRPLSHARGEQLSSTCERTSCHLPKTSLINFLQVGCFTARRDTQNVQYCILERKSVKLMFIPQLTWGENYTYMSYSFSCEFQEGTCFFHLRTSVVHFHRGKKKKGKRLKRLVSCTPGK